MVRRTKEEAAATREQLLEAAERVFRERGVSNTSLAEIAAAAGVTRGAVYWHFRDKIDLFDAMCQRATEPMHTVLERAGDDARGDALGTLRALCVDTLTHLATDARAQAFFEIVFLKTELVGEMAQACRHEQESASARLRIQAVLTRAIAQRQLPADTDTALAAHVVHAAVIGLMHEWIASRRTYDLARTAPAAIDVLISGLRTSPPRKARSRRRGAARPAVHAERR